MAFVRVDCVEMCAVCLPYMDYAVNIRARMSMSLATKQTCRIRSGDNTTGRGIMETGLLQQSVLSL